MGELLYLKASCRAILILPWIAKTVALLFHGNRSESKEERSCEADITSSHMAGLIQEGKARAHKGGHYRKSHRYFDKH
jgi:hypothetical protein